MTMATQSPPAVSSPPTWFRRAMDSDVMYSFRRSPVAIVAAFVTAVLVLAAVFAPLIAPPPKRGLHKAGATARPPSSREAQPSAPTSGDRGEWSLLLGSQRVEP